MPITMKESRQSLSLGKVGSAVAAAVDDGRVAVEVVDVGPVTDLSMTFEDDHDTIVGIVMIPCVYHAMLSMACI